jgi:hypothetical protein
MKYQNLFLRNYEVYRNTGRVGTGAGAGLFLFLENSFSSEW